MIYYKKTDKPKIYKIYDDYNSQFIGHLNLKFNGAVLIYPSSIYRKYDAFGLHKDVLIDPTINFKWVIAKFKGEGQHISREYMLKNGIEEEFNFGIKVFIPRKYWINKNSIIQLNLPFEGSGK